MNQVFQNNLFTNLMVIYILYSDLFFTHFCHFCSFFKEKRLA